MRGLRDRLNAISSKPPAPRAAASTDCFIRETRFPLSELGGVEHTRIAQVRRVEPNFSGYGWDVRRLLFLDTETTGLSGGAGTLAFLVGLGFVEGDELVIRQLLMRDYPEEPILLSHVADLMERFDAYVTFNGKSFDLPLLESRMTMHRMRNRYADLPHLDLLHPARRIWKLRLGRCNLAALEEAVLGEGRADDLPGALVPERYFEYLKTRDFALLEDVLHHNMLDIRSLAVLLARLCQAMDVPEQQSFCQDVYSAGRALERFGYLEEARRCYRVASTTELSERARVSLALSYRRERDYARERQECLEMIRRNEGGVFPYIELAKICEHRLRDLSGAMRYTLMAMEYISSLPPWKQPEPELAQELERRRKRLYHKLHPKECACGKARQTRTQDEELPLVHEHDTV